MCMAGYFKGQFTLIPKMISDAILLRLQLIIIFIIRHFYNVNYIKRNPYNYPQPEVISSNVLFFFQVCNPLT